MADRLTADKPEAVHYVPPPPKPLRENPAPIRLDGPTANGGAYSVTYTHYDGEVVTVEFDAGGAEIARNTGMPLEEAPKGKGKHEVEHEPEAKHKGFGR